MKTSMLLLLLFATLAACSRDAERSPAPVAAKTGEADSLDQLESRLERLAMQLDRYEICMKAERLDCIIPEF